MYNLFSVSGIDVYGNGTLKLTRAGGVSLNNDDYLIPPENTRGKISNLSRRSLARLAFVSRETSVDFDYFATLTYPANYPDDGRKSKEHLNRHCGWYRRRNMSYLWFLEFQIRGAPHYHVFLSGYDGDRIGHAKSWARAVSNDDEEYRLTFSVHSRPEFLEPIRNKNGAARYATKYALKTKQKAVPKGYLNCGRFWGCSNDVLSNIPTPGHIEVNEAEVRLFLKNRGHPAWDWDILPKYLFLND